MEPIIFRQGEENGIVIERKDFDHSIMQNQYQQAINIFHRLWSQQQILIKKLGSSQRHQNDIWIDNQFSNVIAFCGDRGEGKSSCMASFATMLTDKDAQIEAKKVLNFPNDDNDNDLMLSPEKIEWLDVIDPAFFDDEHNLLELLLGRICIKAQEKSKSDCEKDGSNAYKHRKLMEQLEVVKRCITTMTPKKDKPLYDSIEEISELAAGMRLKTELQTLFACYLDFVGKECLLICIDDLDLNISQGYKMSEMLRKYLINPYCIILVSVKVEQLIDIIATEHKHLVKDTEISWEQCKLMAQKSVAKLLPRGNRVVMPSFDEISERDLIILDENGKKLGDSAPVKESVVQMIFQKTGYVFYNTRYLSPIIPANLRSLRHLLATLISLPDARDENWDDDETGREVFKDYFFGTWVEANLNPKDNAFAQQLADYDDLSTLNAFIVEYFAKRIKEDEKIEFKPEKEAGKGKSNAGKKKTSSEQDDDDEDDIDEVALKEEYIQLYNNITNRSNTATNISYGDVMYVLWLINGISLNQDIQKLIFFIKTVYSMRLYACYNIISEEPTETKPSNLYPPTPDVEKEIHIHQADRWYEHVNQVQRLVNGAYFTYPQSGFLPMTKDKKYRDRSTINFDVLKKWLKEEIKIAYNKETKSFEPDKTLLLKVCELMALYIVRTTISKEKEKELGYNRIAKVPPHLWQFSDTAHYAIIDFLQPFYSLCNIEYAYRRFDNIMGVEGSDSTYSLYNIALNTKDSLLNQLYNSSFVKKEDDEKITEEKIFWRKQHSLISDSVIRISDVQWAIYDELLRSRDLHKSTDVIHLAYKDIQDLKIKLYPLNRKDNPEHKVSTLKFNFLPVISSLLSKYFDIDKDKSKENKQQEYEYIQARLNEIDINPNKEQSGPEAIIKVGVTIYNKLNKKRWPKTGAKIRSMISAATGLPDAQRRQLTNNLRNIIADDKEYTLEEINSKMADVLAQYAIIKESSN